MSVFGTLTSGVSALKTYAKGLEVIGNNIANVNTTGFKASRTEYSDSFSDLLQGSSPSPVGGGGSNTAAMQVGTGIRLASITSSWEQGNLSPTGSNTDLGISGEGFFRVRDVANGRDFVTRSGDFRLDDQGYLVTSEGYRVQGLFDGSATFDAVDAGSGISFVKTAVTPTTVGDIKVNFSIGIGSGLTNSSSKTDAEVELAKPGLQNFTVDRFGNVVLSLSNGDSFTAGKVLLQNFRDPNALVREGGNLFSGLNAAGPMGGLGLSEINNTPGSNGLGRIEVGTLEFSNVDLTGEFANLITTQRSFQAGSRIITVADDILEEVINLKR